MLKNDNFPAGKYKFKGNNGNTRTRCEICLKLTIKSCFGVFIVNIEQASAGWAIWKVHVPFF